MKVALRGDNGCNNEQSVQRGLGDKIQEAVNGTMVKWKQKRDGLFVCIFAAVGPHTLNAARTESGCSIVPEMASLVLLNYEQHITEHAYCR